MWRPQTIALACRIMGPWLGLLSAKLLSPLAWLADLVPVSPGKHSRQRRISFPSLIAFQLARATVRDPKTGVLTVASYRVSKRLAKMVVVVVGWLLKPQL